MHLLYESHERYVHMKSFFLGSASFNGYHALHNGYISSENIERLYILKGCTACTKTAFLNALGCYLTEHNYEVQYILNPYEPDIPDGIGLPSLKLMIIDGGSPQYLEPVYTGERDVCLDLSAFVSPNILGTAALVDEYYKRLSCSQYFLKAAGLVSRTLTVGAEAKDIISKRARGLIDREIKKTGRKKGRQTRLFIDSFTYKGLVTRAEGIYPQYKKLISLDNGCDASKLLLMPLAEAALNRGYDVICCPSPFEPETLWHVLVPELSLAFISARGGRRLHLDKIVYAAMTANEKQAYRAAQALREQLLLKVMAELKEAKKSSDSLDEIYKSHTDFEALKKYAEDFIKQLAL